MATFITSKTIGETINITVNTSTGNWKYNHNGSNSSVLASGSQTITVANSNGEFTILPCDKKGTVSGDITILYSISTQLTSFDGTGLSSLTNLRLMGNQLTSFDGTGLSSLESLNLNDNQLTSFDGTDLSSLTDLILSNNQLTSFDGTGLSSLTNLHLGNNPIPALVNNQILADLVGNNVLSGYLDITGPTNLVRTTASNADFTYLTNDLSWTVNGTYSFPSSGLGKLRVKGITQISFR